MAVREIREDEVYRQLAGLRERAPEWRAWVNAQTPSISHIGMLTMDELCDLGDLLDRVPELLTLAEAAAAAVEAAFDSGVPYVIYHIQDDLEEASERHHFEIVVEDEATAIECAWGSKASFTVMVTPYCVRVNDRGRWRSIVGGKPKVEP